MTAVHVSATLTGAPRPRLPGGRSFTLAWANQKPFWWSAITSPRITAGFLAAAVLWSGGSAAEQVRMCCSVINPTTVFNYLTGVAVYISYTYVIFIKQRLNNASRWWIATCLDGSLMSSEVWSIRLSTFHLRSSFHSLTTFDPDHSSPYISLTCLPLFQSTLFCLYHSAYRCTVFVCVTVCITLCVTLYASLCFINVFLLLSRYY